MIKLLLFPSEREQHNNETLCLSLSLFFVPTDTRAQIAFCASALFALKCEGQKCLFPSSKGRTQKNYYLGCIQNPKLRERNARPFLSSSSEHFLVVIYIITINDNMSTTSASLFNNNTSSCVYKTTVTTTRSSIISQNKDEARRPRTLVVLRVLLVPRFLSQEEEGLRLLRGRVAVAMRLLLLLLLLAREGRILRTTASTPTLA